MRERDLAIRGVTTAADAGHGCVMAGYYARRAVLRGMGMGKRRVSLYCTPSASTVLRYREPFQPPSA